MEKSCSLLADLGLGVLERLLLSPNTLERLLLSPNTPVGHLLGNRVHPRVGLPPPQLPSMALQAQGMARQQW